MKAAKETKWDKLYDPETKSLFSRLEEFVINTYFSGAFTRAILAASNIKRGKIFEPGSGGGMACATCDVYVKEFWFDKDT